MIFLVFGKHTINNLLKSKNFNFKKILIREEYKKDKRLIEEIKEKNINFELISKENFSRYNFDKKNQGIVGFVEKYHYTNFDKLLSSKPKKKFSLIVILDGIEDPQNFGSILRTCAAFEVDGLIIDKKNQVPVNSTVIKVSLGGIAYVPITQVDNLIKTIEELKKRNYFIISSICNSEAKDYNKLNFNSDICLILGNENKGIREKIIKISDELINIRIKKEVSSINVSVSCGIILSKISSQW